MKTKKILLSSSVAAIILTTSALANDTTLDTVDVWETEVVSSSINLNQSSMETKQADHLSDLFRDIPGVDVGGSHSINNKIIIRGVKDEELHVTIDGAKQPSADMFHHQGTLKINPDILKKVSIEVGANSVVHGELGGAVEFETKDGKDFLEKGQTVGGMVTTNYNSNKSIGASIATFGKIGESSDFFAYYSYIDNKNWKTGDGNTELGRDGKIDDILLKYGINIDDNHRVSLSYDKLTDEGDYLPRPNFSTEANVGLNRGDIHPTEYIRDTITAKHTYNKEGKLLVNTTVYSNTMDLTRNENNDNGRGDTLQAIVKNKGINSKAQSSIMSGNTLNTLTYGFTYDKQTSEVDVDGSTYGDDESAKNIAVYFEDSIDFDNGLILTPGIRFTQYSLNGLAGDIDDNEFTYSLGSEYAITDNISLLANYTTLFKGVPMQEIFASYRTVVSENSNLKSETGDNKEFGFKYNENGVLGAENVGFSAKYYITTIENDISYDGTWPTNYYMTNIGDTETKGIEASFAYNLENLKTLFSYTHMNTLQKSTNNVLDTEAGDTFTIGLKHNTTSELELSWNAIFVKKETDSTTNKAGYAVHDIAVKYTPKNMKGVKIIAGIDNLFDKYYASHSSYYGSARGNNATDYEPGRNLKVTLSYKF